MAAAGRAGGCSGGRAPPPATAALFGPSALSYARRLRRGTGGPGRRREGFALLAAGGRFWALPPRKKAPPAPIKFLPTDGAAPQSVLMAVPFPQRSDTEALPGGDFSRSNPLYIGRSSLPHPLADDADLPLLDRSPLCRPHTTATPPGTLDPPPPKAPIRAVHIPLLTPLPESFPP